MNLYTALTNGLWSILILAVMLSVPAAMNTGYAHMHPILRFTLAAMMFGFCIGFLYFTTRLSSYAGQNLSREEFTRFATHLTWVRALLGPLTAGIGLRIVFARR